MHPWSMSQPAAFAGVQGVITHTVRLHRGTASVCEPGRHVGITVSETILER